MNTESIPPVLCKLADVMGADICNNKLEIPEEWGKGYCSGFVFNEHIHMRISNYQLKKEIIIEHPESNLGKRFLYFKFRNVYPQKDIRSSDEETLEMPSVFIATSCIDANEIIAIRTNIASITIEMDASYLSRLLHSSQQSNVLQSLLENSQPLMFEQIITPNLQKTIDEIINNTAGETFRLFFLRVKAEELICRLLMELEKRNEQQLYALHIQDIQTLYKVKKQILEHLETPPVIKTLAHDARMSPTKLKRLFKQVFGNSIFKYYQEFRMQEAARLLRDEMSSVAAVGYQMGFANMSHFSKVFEHHIGKKPKQFSRTGK